MFKRITETTLGEINREKVEIIRSLREKYTLTELLKSVELSKSSYFYALHATQNRDIELETRIKTLRNLTPITAIVLLLVF